MKKLPYARVVRGTYAEDVTLEQDRMSDIGLELSLGGCSIAAEELLLGCQLH